MSSKATTAEPQLLPSPPPSPSLSHASTERDTELPGNINEAYLTPPSSTTNKGKGRMVDSSTEFQQGDQDDDDDEYPPDEMQTKRVEEVSEDVCNFGPIVHPRSLLQCTKRTYSPRRLFANGK
jgi:hypothetical protein